MYFQTYYKGNTDRKAGLLISIASEEEYTDNKTEFFMYMLTFLNNLMTTYVRETGSFKCTAGFIEEVSGKREV